MYFSHISCYFVCISKHFLQCMYFAFINFYWISLLGPGIWIMSCWCQCQVQPEHCSIRLLQQVTQRKRPHVWGWSVIISKVMLWKQKSKDCRVCETWVIKTGVKWFYWMWHFWKTLVITKNLPKLSQHFWHVLWYISLQMCIWYLLFYFLFIKDENCLCITTEKHRIQKLILIPKNANSFLTSCPDIFRIHIVCSAALFSAVRVPALAFLWAEQWWWITYFFLLLPEYICTLIWKTVVLVRVLRKIIGWAI